MLITNLFWVMLGLGIALPATLVLIFNFVIKMTAGDNYNLDLTKIAILYVVALLGWATLFGIKGG